MLVAVAISVVRYTLPYMDGQKHRLEQWVEGQYGVEINIGTITAQWKGAGPAIVLEDLQLVQNAQSPLSLDIKKPSSNWIFGAQYWGVRSAPSALT